MTYSSALFDAMPASPADHPDAQRRKIDRLLDTANVGAGSRVLEIGTGGANSPCAPRLGARMSTRSRCRPSSSAWPGTG